MVFNVAPTLLEIALVAAILSAKCGPALGAVTLGTVAGGAIRSCHHAIIRSYVYQQGRRLCWWPLYTLAYVMSTMKAMSATDCSCINAAGHTLAALLTASRTLHKVVL